MGDLDWRGRMHASPVIYDERVSRVGGLWSAGDVFRGEVIGAVIVTSRSGISISGRRIGLMMCIAIRWRLIMRMSVMVLIWRKRAWLVLNGGGSDMK